MTNPLATADFFALEAGECLDRLESLARPGRRAAGRRLPPRRPGAPRLGAHGGRSSRSPAPRRPRSRSPARCAMAAAGGTRQRRSRWPRRSRSSACWCGGSASGATAETPRAGRLGSRARVAGRPHRRRSRASAAEPGELNTGVRAFVAREGALIASALDRAARALHVAPGDREPLYTVIRRMQSLRGLAELGELAPLPEILDGIELAVGDLTRLYRAAARRGRGHGGRRARAHPPLARHRRAGPARRRGGRGAARSPSSCCAPSRSSATSCPSSPCTSTATPSPARHRRRQPQFAAPAPLGPLELVSHGEHLCQIADLIARVGSATERDLRLYHLVGALRARRTRPRSGGRRARGLRPLDPRGAGGRRVAAAATDDLVTRSAMRGRAAAVGRRRGRPDAGLPPPARRRATSSIRRAPAPRRRRRPRPRATSSRSPRSAYDDTDGRGGRRRSDRAPRA